MKIAVVGSQGMVGQNVLKFWNSPLVLKVLAEKIPAVSPSSDSCQVHSSDLASDFSSDWTEDELIPFDLPDFDVCSPIFVRQTLGALMPDIILNLSGIQLMDWLETHPNTARSIHVQGNASLKLAAKETGALLLGLGTGEIFQNACHSPGGMNESDVYPEMSSNDRIVKTVIKDEKSGINPAEEIVLSDSFSGWKESDIPTAKSVFARTKLDGERALQEAPQHLLIRTSSLYGIPGRQSGGNLVDTIFAAVRRTQTLQVVNDTFSSPTSALELIRALRSLIRLNARGLFHVVNSGQVSPYETARFLLNKTGLKKHELRPISTSDYGIKAVRAIRTSLDTSKYNALSGVYPMQTWQEALSEFLELRSQNPEWFTQN